jgi:hypothetical protein
MILVVILILIQCVPLFSEHANDAPKAHCALWLRIRGSPGKVVSISMGDDPSDHNCRILCGRSRADQILSFARMGCCKRAAAFLISKGTGAPAPIYI